MKKRTLTLRVPGAKPAAVKLSQKQIEQVASYVARQPKKQRKSR